MLNVLTYVLFTILMLPIMCSIRSHPDIVHDSVAPSPRVDQRGILSAATPLPDWSDAKLDGRKRYIEVLLAVDAAVSRYYGHNRDKIVTALTTLMHAVNLYTYQLDIRIVVVDIVAVRGTNLTLEQFLDWRQEQTGLTPHDVAILVRHRYEGGIAYVNGACKRTSVGICGFFPEAPFEYASVFFHELAHLLGLSHDMTSDCRCSSKNRQNCMRIDGFDRDCSAQALVDLLPSLDCLGPPVLPLPRTTLSICGNGVVENDEDCDCGPEGYCDNIFCQPRSCKFILQRKYLYTTFTFGIAVSICLFIVIAKKACAKTDMTNVLPNKYNEDLLASPRKHIISNPEGAAMKEQIQRKSVGTEPVVLPDCAIHLPTLCMLPVRLAPRRPPVSLSLDVHVPLSSDEPITPGYVQMNPAKLSECVRLPSISPSRGRPEISEPIPMIVAGRPVADYMAELDESFKAQTLNRTKKASIHALDENATLPRRAMVPDRKTKPALVVPAKVCLRNSPTPSHKSRLYDLPPLD